jgi:NTP pyrophosphatase (non-canonical NTP hydrolase)
LGEISHTRNLAISISLEAAELLENFQWQVGEEPITHEVKEKASKEIADIFIYLLSMSHDLNIDLIEAATKKLEESHSIYPVEKTRGSSKKYAELK